MTRAAVIAAERKKQPVAALIESILAAHGPVELSLSPVTVAELVHGIYWAKTPEASQRRRQYIEELLSLVPVHPMTRQTGWLVGQIEGQEAAKGNILPAFRRGSTTSFEWSCLKADRGRAAISSTPTPPRPRRLSARPAPM